MIHGRGIRDGVQKNEKTIIVHDGYSYVHGVDLWLHQ